MSTTPRKDEDEFKHLLEQNNKIGTALVNSQEMIRQLQASLNTSQQTNAALTADRKRMEEMIMYQQSILDEAPALTRIRGELIKGLTPDDVEKLASNKAEVHRACNRRELELTANPLEMKVTAEYWQKKYEEEKRLHELESKTAADQVASIQKKLEEAKDTIRGLNDDYRELKKELEIHQRAVPIYDRDISELKAKLEGAEARARQEAEENSCLHRMDANNFINKLVAIVHGGNTKWWTDAMGLKLERNKAELLCLIHSEISEAMEGERKDLMDDKLPHRKMAEVELADTLIRIFDYCGGFNYDLGGAVVEKIEYNRTRADHTHEARAKANGKKF